MSAKIKEVWKIYILHCIRGCSVESECEWKELVLLEHKKDFDNEGDAINYLQSVRKEFEAEINCLILRKQIVS